MNRDPRREQEEHRRQVSEVLASLARAGVKAMRLDDLAKLLPVNPEWARYSPRRRRSP